MGLKRILGMALLLALAAPLAFRAQVTTQPRPKPAPPGQTRPRANLRADTNLVLERARAQGALTLGITNERSSTLAKLAEHVFLVRAGKEKSVAATKTYTGQLLLLYLLAYALGGGVRLSDLQRIPEAVDAALGLAPEIEAWPLP